MEVDVDRGPHLSVAEQHHHDAGWPPSTSYSVAAVRRASCNLMARTPGRLEQPVLRVVVDASSIVGPST